MQLFSHHLKDQEDTQDFINRYIYFVDICSFVEDDGDFILTVLLFRDNHRKGCLKNNHKRCLKDHNYDEVFVGCTSLVLCFKMFLLNNHIFMFLMTLVMTLSMLSLLDVLCFRCCLCLCRLNMFFPYLSSVYYLCLGHVMTLLTTKNHSLSHFLTSKHNNTNSTQS